MMDSDIMSRKMEKEKVVIEVGDKKLNLITGENYTSFAEQFDEPYLNIHKGTTGSYPNLDEVLGSKILNKVFMCIGINEEEDTLEEVEGIMNEVLGQYSKREATEVGIIPIWIKEMPPKSSTFHQSLIKTCRDWLIKYPTSGIHDLTLFDIFTKINFITSYKTSPI